MKIDRKSYTFDSPDLNEIKLPIMKHGVRVFIILLGFALFSCSDKSKVPTDVQPKENTPNEPSEIVFQVNEVEQQMDTLKAIQGLIDRKYKKSKITNLVQGDLNADGRKDVLVITSRSCEPNESVSEESECYRLVICLADGKNNFKFKLGNETVLECSDCQRSDPEVEIKTGVISIITSYGACKRDIFTSVYKYHKQDESWRLTTIDKVLVDCEQDLNTGEPKTTHFPTETVADFGLVKL